VTAHSGRSKTVDRTLRRAARCFSN
jgi:hypothetical protein